MLVLTRKLQERIQIGDNVTITILRVKGQTVRVGIEAPRDLKVKRGELAPLPQAGAEEASNTAEVASAGEPAMVSIPLPASIAPTGEAADGDEPADARAGRRRPLARFAAPARRKMANFTTQPVALLTPALAK